MIRNICLTLLNRNSLFNKTKLLNKEYFTIVVILVFATDMEHKYKLILSINQHWQNLISPM